MKLVRDFQKILPKSKGCVATIGTFDGVHLGHISVLNRVREYAKLEYLPSIAIIFEPLPAEYLSPGNAPARLMSFREKFVAIEKQGIDVLLCIRFNESLRRMSAERVVEDIFVEALRIKHLIFGDDFRFGNNREGDIAFVKKQGKLSGFTAASTPTFSVDGARVSSTRIREALADGNFELAKSLLGRPYSITGKVIYGRQLGRSLGFPTANVELGRLSSPLSGVYAVKVNGEQFKDLLGIANIGVRPTVNDIIRANLEVHLLDFKGQIYGQNIEVTFLSKIREEKKFSSLDELKINIARDERAARLWFDSKPPIGKKKN